MAADAFRPCVVIPTYDNPLTIRGVVEAVRAYVPDVIVVDDGSGAEGERACRTLEEEGLCHRIRFEPNQGKGAACLAGFAHALGLGFTHAAQVDGDGQHDLSKLPELLSTGEATPAALVLGYPVYDDTVPAVRRLARKITDFWVALEVGRGVIRDALIGFRLYPLESTLAAGVSGHRMDFDVEVAVRMSWAGVPIVNFPIPVRYLSQEEGGVSHFRPLLDNLAFSWLHTRLCTTACFRWIGRRLGLVGAPAQRLLG